MLLKSYDMLPKQFKCDTVKQYFELIHRRRVQFYIKTVLERLVALLILIVLSPLLAVVALIVGCTSKGPVMFRQKRVGQYGKSFRILKFRTMIIDADKVGVQLTVGEKDPRITGVGLILRKTRIDELPQLINVIRGEMSLVGARPEVPKYVRRYEDWMMATLLLPPGITGIASIRFKDENELLGEESDPEGAYVRKILPIKMKLDIEYLDEFSVMTDIKIMFLTVAMFFRK